MTWTTAMFVLPTQETVERLQEILAQSPIQIDWPSLRVELARTSRPNVSWRPRPAVRYKAHFLNFKLRVSHTNRVQLVGELDSPDMSFRMNELVPSPELPVPSLIFNDNSPSMHRTNKSFISSVNEVLADGGEQAFTFENEVRIDNK